MGSAAPYVAAAGAELLPEHFAALTAAEQAEEQGA